MRRHFLSVGSYVLVTAPALLALLPGRSTEAAPPQSPIFSQQEAEVEPGRLLVRFRDGTPTGVRASVHAAAAGRLEGLLARTGTELVDVDAARLLATFLVYQRSPHVEFVEPVGVMRATYDCTSGAGSITNDDCSWRQYGLHNDGSSYGPAAGTADADIDAYDAWASGYTGAGITIAVLDTGYDTTHEDVAAKVSADKDFTNVGIEAWGGKTSCGPPILMMQTS